MIRRHPGSPLFPYTTLFRSYAALQASLPDIVILDLSMPGRGGLATLRRLKARWPLLPVLVFSMHEQRSEEHTSELQSRRDLVCRLLLEKKKECITSNKQCSM